MEVGLRQIIHAMTQLRVEQVMGDHRVPQSSSHLHSIMAHHQNIKLDVLADFRNMWILQGRGEVTKHRQSVGFRFWNGHIPSLLFGHGERATHQFGT